MQDQANILRYREGSGIIPPYLSFIFEIDNKSFKEVSLSYLWKNLLIHASSDLTSTEILFWKEVILLEDNNKHIIFEPERLYKKLKLLRAQYCDAFDSPLYEAKLVRDEYVNILDAFQRLKGNVLLISSNNIIDYFKKNHPSITGVSYEQKDGINIAKIQTKEDQERENNSRYNKEESYEVIGWLGSLFGVIIAIGMFALGIIFGVGIDHLFGYSTGLAILSLIGLITGLICQNMPFERYIIIFLSIVSSYMITPYFKWGLVIPGIIITYYLLMFFLDYFENKN